MLHLLPPAGSGQYNHSTNIEYLCVRLCSTHVRFGCEQGDNIVSSFKDSLESSGRDRQWVSK